MPAPRHQERSVKLQPRKARAAAPRSFHNDLLIPVADKIRGLRSEAAGMQATGVSPFELLVHTRPSRLELAKRLANNQRTAEERLDTLHKTRFAAYRMFLHGIVLMPPLMAYGPDDTEARAIRHVLGRGIHPLTTSLAAQAARRTTNGASNAAATREATLLALGTRQANPNGPILPALTWDTSQKEQAECFRYGEDNQVMHTHIHLDGSSWQRIPDDAASKPGLAVISQRELGLVSGCHPWNAPISNQTVFALEEELSWQQIPSYNQNAAAMHDTRAKLQTITDNVMGIIHNHMVVYDPTA